MYCIVKYSEVDRRDSEVKEKGKIKDKVPKQEERKYSIDRTSQKSIDNKLEIKYDDEVKELIINPNCFTKILLDYVSEQLCIEKDVEFDFCDELGRLTKIDTLKNWEYATEALVPQMTYVVLLFRRDKSGKLRNIRPVLTKNCKLFCEILQHLKTQFSSSSIYISDKSSSFSRSKAGSRASLKSTDKHRSSDHSKSSDRIRKGLRRSPQTSSAHFLRKSSSKNTIRGSTKSIQAILGMDSEVEIKPKKVGSKSSPKSKQGKKNSK